LAKFLSESSPPAGARAQGQLQLQLHRREEGMNDLYPILLFDNDNSALLSNGVSLCKTSSVLTNAYSLLPSAPSPWILGWKRET
jgi:hypothetical protein